MRKCYLVLFVMFYSLPFFSQSIGGQPADGVIPIKRIDYGLSEDVITDKTINNSTSTVNTSPTGTSSEVGITEGQFAVSLSGAATYNIPIALPPGINNVLPKISLSYSSQSNNGIAGFGWNISGISTISRIPSTKFHDNTIDAVDFDNLDRFAFDGQRLIIKNGTSGVYGANATIYETESFSNLKITSYGVHPNGANYGPAYFMVEYPDGSIAQYGNSLDSRTLTDYAINYWQNPQGVRITYDYTISNNIINVASVKYGSIGSNTQINEIQFVYKTRQRLEQYYVGGQSFIRNTILSEIKVKSNGVAFRNYLLTHDVTSLGYERLVSFTEKTGDNLLSLNPTVFGYETTSNNTLFDPQGQTQLNLSGVNYTNSQSVSGDFDGDGKTDLIIYPTIGTSAKQKYWLYNNLQSSSLNIGAEHNIGGFEEIFPISWLGGSASYGYKLMPMQGWCVVKTNSITNLTSFKNYSVGTVSPIYFQDEKSYEFPKLTFGYWTDPCILGKDAKRGIVNRQVPVDPNDPVYNEIVRNIPKKYLTGDFNGDSLTDVVVVEKPVSITYFTGGCSGYNATYNYSGGKSYFLNLDRRLTSNYVNVAGQMQTTLDSKFEVGDVNGDGKSDIIVFDAGSVKVYTLNDLNQLVSLFSLSDVNILMDKPILMGDYNADGKFDFVIPQANNVDSWCFYHSKGTGFVKTPTAIGMSYYESRTGNYVQYGLTSNTTSLNEISYISNDFNGDGKTDILIQQNLTAICVYGPNGCDYSYDGTPEATKLSLLENKSTSTNPVAFNYVDTMPQITGVNRYPIPIFTNHNKINQNLEYALVSGGTIRSYKSPKDNRVDVLLKAITTGNGVVESISYSSLIPTSLSNSVSFYSDTAYTENYPNIDIIVAPSFKIVTKVEKQSNSVYKRQLFYYHGAVTDVSGLGFLGFRSTMRTNWHDDNVQIISSISRSDISKRGANIENFSIAGLYLPNDSSPTSGFISKNINIYNTIDNTNFDPILLPNKVVKLVNNISYQYNGLDNTSTQTLTIYDAFNNPIQSTSYLKNGGTIEQTTYGTITYEPPITSPLYIVGKPSGKTQTITIYPGQSNQDVSSSEELYTYNNNLLTKVRKKGTNSGVTTGYMQEDNVYDVFGNITQKTITAPTAGLAPRITNYEYNPIAPYNGRFLTKSYDVENIATTFSYDTNTGTLISETSPYGLVTSYTYNKWLNRIKITDYLGKNKTFTYNRNNEKTLITNTGDDGSSSTELYDDLGRKIKVSVKDINGNFSNTSYLYDIYDRNYKVSEPYFGATPTQWNETKYDDYGRVTQSISYTGKNITIVYNGLITTINENITSGSPPTSTTLKSKTSIKNSIGKVISLSDSPGGTINYTYFANGNLKSSTFDASTITIIQDGWGRKKELTDPSAGTYRYEYNDFGETTKETVLNVITNVVKGITTYDINSVGKTNWKTIVGQNGDNTNSKTTYTYDPTTKLLTGIRFDDYTAGFYTLYSYGYDSYKRLNFKDESGFLAYYQQAIQYDTFGRPFKELYSAVNTSDMKSSIKWIRYTYQNGYQYQILDDATGGILRQINTVNAKGQVLTAKSSYFTEETHTYDNFGFPSNISYKVTSGPYASATPFLQLGTSFNPQRGNLSFRTNSMFGTYDNFSYDNLDRLTSYPNETGVMLNQSYDDKGKIITNNIGTYTYVSDKPYQLSSITPTDQSASSPVLNYYLNREQNVTYNVFKSPVTITEQGKENIDFEYNAFNERSTMYYGSLDQTKTARPLRKFYSADGTMEIKRNIVTNAVEFITYIGGDGYSAPLVLKSDGITQTYLYLHRDYQGSILAITNDVGQVLEKRCFDAWGSLIKYANSSGVTTVPTSSGLMLLDRGYIGHEHLLGVGLINMNARLYDPKLHRFLQPDNFIQDPSNTQSYNRYSYCWNNPLKYADYNGEWFGLDDLIVAAASFVVGYLSSAITSGDWGWKSVKSGLISAATGWIAYNTLGASTFSDSCVSGNTGMWNFIASSAVTATVSFFIPPIGIDIGDWSISISPAIALGSTTGIGASLSVTYSDGDFSFSAGVGIMSNSNYNGLGKNGLEIRKSIMAAYDDGKTGFSLGANFWNGEGGMSEFKQQTGVLGIHSGDFRFSYENDGFPFNYVGLGDGHDSYRSAAATVGIGEFSAGFNLFTGKRENYSGDKEKVGNAEYGTYGEKMPNGYVNEEGPQYRFGGLSLRYGNYSVGINSDRYVRHPIQDRFAHSVAKFCKQPGFHSLSDSINPYFQYKTSNIFTSW